MDRAPKPAPFAVGTRVRYVGTRSSYTMVKGEKVWLVAPGKEFDIIEATPGRRGTLRQMRDADGPMTWDDTGEPILDETRDGGSIYVSPSGMRCMIVREAAHEWEEVS